VRIDPFSNRDSQSFRGLHMTENSVPSQSVTIGGVLLVPASAWRLIFRIVLPLSLVYAGLLVAESYAIARIDWWLPITSFEDAVRYSSLLGLAAQWLRLIIIGLGIFLAFNSLRRDAGVALPTKFLILWSIVGLLLALSLTAVDAILQEIQFNELVVDNAVMRWIWLASVYARIVFFYIAARLMLGALCFARDPHARWRAAWNATSLLQSIALVFGLLVLNQIIETVFVNVVSYLPVVSPFWFIPSELSPMRDLVGMGARIIAQSCGVFFYVAFAIAAQRLISKRAAES
jgi:hypothetical protein